MSKTETHDTTGAPLVPQRRGGWFRFSLKSLIVLMLLCGCLLGWVTMRLQRGWGQAEAVKQLRAAGLEVFYDYQSQDGVKLPTFTAPTTTWWRDSLGNDFFDQVVLVQRSSSLPISNSDARHLEALPHLQFLFLSNAKLTDREASHLRNLVELRELDLWDSQITDDGLRNLRRHRKLKRLLLGGSPIRGPGLVHLEQMSSLRDLYLSHTDVDDDGLAYLRGLQQLRILTLFGTEITDDCIPHLSELKNLDYLMVSNTRISERGLAQLRAALPNCEIQP